MLTATTPVATADPVTQSGSFGPVPYNGDEQSRCQGMHVGSHIVFAGTNVTATTTGGICGAAPKDVTWAWGVAPGTAVSGCGMDATSCVFKAGASTGGQYTLVCINGSTVQGAWQSCDYYGVPDPAMGAIEGYVKDKSGDPVAGVDVTAYGTKSGGGATNADGYYAIQVRAGHYRVLASGAPSGKSTPSYEPGVTDVTVGGSSSAQADFQLQAAIELQLHFDRSAVPADGRAVVNGTITTTELGKPRPNVTVQLEIMPGEKAAEAVAGGPRASVCNSGSRLWPTGTISGPDGSPVNIVTDATGHYALAVTVGTTPGIWTMDAWAQNSDGALSSDVSAASDTQSIRFTPLGSARLSDFVSEFNLAAKSTAALRTVSADAPPLVHTLAQETAKGSSGAKFGGLAYGLVNAKDGASLVVFVADKPPVVSSSGELPPAFAANANDPVIDGAEWTGAGLAASVTNAASLQYVLDSGLLPDVPTLTEFDSGAPVKAWKTLKQDLVTPFSSSFEYLGWGYPGLGAAGACY